MPAALAGLAAAAAMLGKYWSIFLLAGLGLAALVDPRRRAYFRSAAPWITIAVGALALAPHVWWLLGQGSSTFGYGMAAHPGTYGSALVSGLGYIAGTLGYIAVPAALALFAARPSQAALADALWPREPERRFVAVAFWTPVFLPALVAVATQTRIVPIWGIGGMTLLPVILLSSPLTTVSRVMVRRIVGFAIALPLLALAASPIVALVIHQRGVENYADHYRLIAEAVQRTWRNDTGKPLRIFGSVGNILHGASFYLADAAENLRDRHPGRDALDHRAGHRARRHGHSLRGRRSGLHVAAALPPGAHARRQTHRGRARADLLGN